MLWCGLMYGLIYMIIIGGYKCMIKLIDFNGFNKFMIIFVFIICGCR